MFANLCEVNESKTEISMWCITPIFVKQVMQRKKIKRIHKNINDDYFWVVRYTIFLLGRQNCDLESNKPGSTAHSPCHQRQGF